MADGATTAMAEALQAAGFVPAQTGLDRIAVEAWGRFPKAGDVLGRQNYVIERLNGELTYSLLKQFDPHTLGKAITWILGKAERGIVQQRPGLKPVGGGLKAIDTHVRNAPATVNVQPQAERRSEPAIVVPSPREVVPAAPSLTQMADKQAARTAVRLSVGLKLCRLDTILVSGKPIGDCTVGEVREWAAVRETEMRSAGRDVLFARNLVANLPSGAVIRDWWKNPAEVDRIYAKAEAEYAA